MPPRPSGAAAARRLMASAAWDALPAATRRAAELRLRYPYLSLVELAAAADPATRTYAARIRILDPLPAAQLGMTARVVLGSPSGVAIVVPLTAIVDNGKGPQVWVASDGKAMLRPVEVAAFREDGAVIASGLKAAMESEQITAQTEAVLKSTGNAAGVTGKQVQDLANTISAYSGKSDESVREAQNMLLTFKQVRNETGKGNDVFTQATKSIADMSTAPANGGDELY